MSTTPKARGLGASVVAACLVAVLAFAGADASAKPHAPPAERAYPLNQVSANLAAQAEQDACDFEAHQEGKRRGLLIFGVGRASRMHGKFGVGANSNFHDNNRVYKAMLSAGRAYSRCRNSPRRRIDIGYGVTNYKLSKELTTHRGSRSAGKAQGRVVHKLSRHLPQGVGAAAAGDIEPGWNPKGAGQAFDLVHGGAGAPGAYYNYGTIGHCTPFGSGCQGNWSQLEIGRMAQDSGISALPQIYYPKQAKAWDLVARRWDGAGDNCGHERKRGCFDFAGITAYPRGCSGVEFTPAKSWLRMRGATRHEVGRRVVLFNPRRVNCRPVDGGPAPRTALDLSYDLPLMPEEVPAEIVEDPDPVLSEYEMDGLVNAWRAGTHREYTWVYAGRAEPGPDGEASPDGRLLITREVYSRDRPVERTVQAVDVASAGALRIVAAPEGHRAIGPALDGGQISVTGESGIEGVLDLGDLKITR